MIAGAFLTENGKELEGFTACHVSSFFTAAHAVRAHLKAPNLPRNGPIALVGGIALLYNTKKITDWS